jgi:predicted component of type VI protein secretion system
MLHHAINKIHGLGHNQKITIDYEHCNIRHTLATLLDTLESVVGQALPNDIAVFATQAQQNNIMSLSHIKPKYLNNYDCFIVVKSSAGFDKQLFAQQLKISSIDNINALIHHASSGLSCELSNQQIQSEYSYYRCQQQGEHWQAICNQGDIAVFINASFAISQLSIIFIANDDHV